MEKVIPPGLNYADIKPEAIENQIRIIKYTPISTVQQAQPNDVIRFHLQGNGFFDPYSAYLRVEVDMGAIPALTATQGFAGKFLDRSAHSLFNRLVIRSQGTELERIENYDVMAAMINDMLYSHEQRILHQYEGFACQSRVQSLGQLKGLGARNHVAALPLLVPNADQNISTHHGEFGAWKLAAPTGDAPKGSAISIESSANAEQVTETYLPANNIGTHTGSTNAAEKAIGDAADVTTTELAEYLRSEDFVIRTEMDTEQVLGLHQEGKAFSVGQAANGFKYNKMYGTGTAAHNAATPLTIVEDGIVTWSSGSKFVFQIPIYSGIIGVLMPEKKFLPLSLLPLEVELTVNPFALYAAGNCDNRNFIVTKCEIFCHTLFFEQELHRSLEAVVAETGIFIHYNSFYLGPINSYNPIVQEIGGYAQIGVYLKSINSLHWVYMYGGYQNDPRVRKLHFVSHNMKSLQLRNGMDLIPSEPILGQVGGQTVGAAVLMNNHSQFLIETYKAWNKMHDPLSDAAITPVNYGTDQAPIPVKTLKQLIRGQTRLGRCQYGLTLEGEELGNQKAIVTGKRSVMPFDLNWTGSKTEAIISYLLMFIRADFIIYVRPDLVVTRLGL